VNGFTAQAPVKTPSFSVSALVRATLSVRRILSTNAATSFRLSSTTMDSTSGCSGASTA
jgi:hypothetical protein